MRSHGDLKDHLKFSKERFTNISHEIADKIQAITEQQ
jgi:hypothetical protein